MVEREGERERERERRLTHNTICAPINSVFKIQTPQTHLLYCVVFSHSLPVPASSFTDNTD